MPESTSASAEPLLEEASVSRSAGKNVWKALAIVAMFAGCAGVLSTVRVSSYPRGEGEQRGTNLAAYIPPVGTSRQFLMPTLPGYAMQPTKVWQLLAPARTRKPLLEPARARYGKESLGPGKGMTGEVGEDFSAWGDLATLGSGEKIVPEAQAWLAYEQTDGEVYNPEAPMAPDQRPSESSEPGVPGRGIVANWITDKGFGFIKPDDGGDDIYAHVSELVGGPDSVKRGDEVTYVKEFNTRRSKDQAVKVELVPDGKRGSDSGDGDAAREVGKLIRWNEEKGYGFVKPKDGDDLFLHVSNLLDGPASVKIGNEISYIKNYDKKRDKIRAVKARVATEEDKKAAEEAAAAEPAAAEPAAAEPAAPEPSAEEATPAVAAASEPPTEAL